MYCKTGWFRREESIDVLPTTSRSRFRMLMVFVASIRQRKDKNRQRKAMDRKRKAMSRLKEESSLCPDRKRKAMVRVADKYLEGFCMIFVSTVVDAGAGLPDHAHLEDAMKDKNRLLEDAMKDASRKDTLHSLPNRELETARVKSEDHDRAIDDFKTKVRKISVLEDETDLGKEERRVTNRELEMLIEQQKAMIAMYAALDNLFSAVDYLKTCADKDDTVEDLETRADKDDIIRRSCHVEHARLYISSLQQTKKKGEASWASYFDTFKDQDWKWLGLSDMFLEDGLDQARDRQKNVRELLKHGIKGMYHKAHGASPRQQAQAIKMLEVKGDMDAYQKEKDLFHYVHGEELNDFLDI